MAAPKGVNNKCPICGKPRGKGPYEFSHGKCLEQQAKPLTEPRGNGQGKFDRITIDQANRARLNGRKKAYLQGRKLPDWMYS